MPPKKVPLSTYYNNLYKYNDDMYAELLSEFLDKTIKQYKNMKKYKTTQKYTITIEDLLSGVYS
jgi:hypothetical protein